jgi:hypothetical protein
VLNEREIRYWPAALFLCALIFVAAFGAYSGSSCKACTADAKASADWWMTVLTGGLVAVGLGQIVLFYRQLRLMREGLSGAMETAEAARTSAEAAKASVELASLTAERQLRAYVFLGPNFPPTFVVGEFPEVQFVIENSGQTPAHELRRIVSHGVV